MEAKTARFEMRLDQRMLDRVDVWRADQRDYPSRAEAVRQLIDVGLSASSSSQLKFSDAEKLNTLMLCDIFKHLEIESDIDPEFVEAAVHGGHFWGLVWKYPGIYHGHKDNEQVVTEVADVLAMWYFIESGYEKLSKKDKERVKTEAEPFGEHVTFLGFDGNNESEYMGIAHFLICKLDRFSNFEGRDLNSHIPSIETYRRMFGVFEPMQRNLMGGELSASQIIDILKAMIHPQHRVS